MVVSYGTATTRCSWTSIRSSPGRTPRGDAHERQRLGRREGCDGTARARQGRSLFAPQRQDGQAGRRRRCRRRGRRSCRSRALSFEPLIESRVRARMQLMQPNSLIVQVDWISAEVLFALFAIRSGSL